MAVIVGRSKSPAVCWQVADCEVEDMQELRGARSHATRASRRLKEEAAMLVTREDAGWWAMRSTCSAAEDAGLERSLANPVRPQLNA
jgi:hypothetical protein